MGIVKRLWINCAAKNGIFMDRLSAACEKTILFASFFVIRTNGYNTVCSLLTLSLFLNTNKKLAITLYRRRHKSNSRKYWKSGAEMEVDQIGWGKMWQVNYSTSSQTMSWNALKIGHIFWTSVRDSEEGFIFLDKSLSWCCQALCMFWTIRFFVYSCELKVFLNANASCGVWCLYSAELFFIQPWHFLSSVQTSL